MDTIEINVQVDISAVNMALSALDSLQQRVAMLQKYMQNKYAIGSLIYN